MAKVFTLPATDAKRSKPEAKSEVRTSESGSSPVLTIPALPDIGRTKRERTSDPRFLDGQKMLVQAMNYLVKADKEANRSAIDLLSEHVRTKFRMSDRPLS
jgi:hypothetical protein